LVLPCVGIHPDSVAWIVPPSEKRENWVRWPALSPPFGGGARGGSGPSCVQNQLISRGRE